MIHERNGLNETAETKRLKRNGDPHVVKQASNKSPMSKYRERKNSDDENDRDFNQKLSGSDVEDPVESDVERDNTDVNALAAGVMSIKLEYDLEGINLFYHVTNSKLAFEKILVEGLQSFQAKCQIYDGKLTAREAPSGIFFTVTRYDRGDHSLPTITQYPRDGNDGQKYPRIAIRIEKLNLEDYHLFLVQQPCHPPNAKKQTLQLHVAFIHNTRETHLAWAEKHLFPLDKTDNGIFELQGKQWFAPKMKQSATCDVWTNVFLVPSLIDDNLDTLLPLMRTAIYGEPKRSTSNVKFKSKSKKYYRKKS